MVSAALLAAGACTSYEIDMPENPEPPVVGREVSKEVAYQANPRFFGDKECLKALTAQLPRIADMGTDILWVMPVCEPGELNAFGSPYCIRDFKKVNPRYGTLDDLKTLVADAHSRGMRVILDWVANHTSWDNPWVKAHPDWYVHGADGAIISPSGWTDVAQLDFSNPEVCAAMTDAMKYWVEEAGIDGYRCDYADGVPHDYWQELISALRSLDADLIMLAESSKTEFYADGFNMIYDWNSSTTISDAFKGGRPASVVTEAQEALAKVPDEAGKSILRYVFNHDVAADNDVDRMFGNSAALPAAYVCASMLNGTPLVYSSMDVEGLRGKLSFFNYQPMTFSDELTARYKAINAAFKKSEEVRRGELTDFSNSNVVCFMRSTPGHYLLVAVNTTSSLQTVRTPITLAGSTMSDLIDGGETTLSYTMQLEPYAYTILMR